MMLRWLRVLVSTASLRWAGSGESLPPQENVNAAIEELGFVRNRQASWALRGGQSGVIGLIVRGLSAPFYAELTAGLTEALEAQGRMVFCFTAVKTARQQYTDINRAPMVVIAGLAARY